ncbi:MAG: hypothetical protein CL912_15015 [Deltaproteobacteria bacterium]|nr:hypothetical protein [Deltaproteobacteria bacterium]
MLVARGVEEIGYGGIDSDGDIWEEAGAHYVRARRGRGGGWFLVRKEGQQGEKDEEYPSRHQASALRPTSAV